MESTACCCELVLYPFCFVSAYSPFCPVILLFFCASKAPLYRCLTRIDLNYLTPFQVFSPRVAVRASRVADSRKALGNGSAVHDGCAAAAAAAAADACLCTRANVSGARCSCVVSPADFKKLWPRPADPKVLKNPVISLATSQGLCIAVCACSFVAPPPWILHSLACRRQARAGRHIRRSLAVAAHPRNHVGNFGHFACTRCRSCVGGSSRPVNLFFKREFAFLGMPLCTTVTGL